MDDKTNQQAERVDDDVALAAHDLLAGVKASYSTTFGGLDRFDAAHPFTPAHLLRQAREFSVE